MWSVYALIEMLVQFILPLQMGFKTKNSHKDREWMGVNSVLRASVKMLQLLHADWSGITWKHHIAYFCKWCIIRRRQVLSRFSQVHSLYPFFYRFTTVTSITCSLVGENHNCSDLSSFCLMSSPKAEMKMIAAPPPCAWLGTSLLPFHFLQHLDQDRWLRHLPFP